MKWSLIIEAYRKAEECLWGSRSGAGDRENGMIYLQEAYYEALKAETKEHLWYARILFMMHEQSRGRCGDSLIKEACREYMLAADTEKTELEQARLAYKKTRQRAEVHSCQENQRKELSNIIGGQALPEDFCFYNSRVVFFQQDGDSARLKLESGGIPVTFGFEGIYGITASLAPEAAWITGITCRCHTDSNAIVFDIGAYKIICTRIDVIAVS